MKKVFSPLFTANLTLFLIKPRPGYQAPRQRPGHHDMAKWASLVSKICNLLQLKISHLDVIILYDCCGNFKNRAKFCVYFGYSCLIGCLIVGILSSYPYILTRNSFLLSLICANDDCIPYFRNPVRVFRLSNDSVCRFFHTLRWSFLIFYVPRFSSLEY